VAGPLKGAQVAGPLKEVQAAVPLKGVQATLSFLSPKGVQAAVLLLFPKGVPAQAAPGRPPAWRLTATAVAKRSGSRKVVPR
jgi:hypothetical protein